MIAKTKIKCKIFASMNLWSHKIHSPIELGSDRFGLAYGCLELTAMMMVCTFDRYIGIRFSNTVYRVLCLCILFHRANLGICHNQISRLTFRRRPPHQRMTHELLQIELMLQSESTHARRNHCVNWMASYLCRFVCTATMVPCAPVDIPAPKLSKQIRGIVSSILIRSNIENAPNLAV